MEELLTSFFNDSSVSGRFCSSIFSYYFKKNFSVAKLFNVSKIRLQSYPENSLKKGEHLNPNSFVYKIYMLLVPTLCIHQIKDKDISQLNPPLLVLFDKTNKHFYNVEL